MNTQEQQTHPLPPIFDTNSKVLILGSFPSVLSRKNFYYAHPQNRFWQVLASVLNETTPDTLQSKTAFLLRNKLAVWDVVQSCSITGSSDHSIANVVVNDLQLITSQCNLNAIFLNGNKAFELYQKHMRNTCSIPAYVLPSTSPANAAYSLNKLIQKWQIIKTVF